VMNRTVFSEDTVNGAARAPDRTVSARQNAVAISRDVFMMRLPRVDLVLLV
jgi:hypothetical protein